MKLGTIFDSLQMLAPSTVRARMTLQETWLLGLGWDEEFPVGSRCQGVTAKLVENIVDASSRNDRCCPERFQSCTLWTDSEDVF